MISHSRITSFILWLSVATWLADSFTVRPDNFTVRPDNFTVRPAVLKDDLPRIGELFELTEAQLQQIEPCFPTGKERHGIFCVGSPLIGMIEVDCRQYLVDNVTHVIYAIPGPLVQFTNDPCIEERNSATLCNLYVHPDHRRQGIATKLVKYAIKHIFDNRWHCRIVDYGDGEQMSSSCQVRGQVLANNTAAMRFFEAQGFSGSCGHDGVVYIDKSLPNMERKEYKTLREKVREYGKGEKESDWAKQQQWDEKATLNFLVRDIGRDIKRKAKRKVDEFKLWFRHGFRSPPCQTLRTQAEIDAFEATNPRCLIGYTLRSEKQDTSYYYPWHQACQQLQKRLPDLSVAEVDLSDPDCNVQDLRGRNNLCLEYKYQDDSEIEKSKRSQKFYFDLRPDSVEDLIDYCVQEDMQSNAKANHTQGLPIHATRKELMDMTGRYPCVSDVGAIHLQINSTLWARLEPLFVEELAKRQQAEPYLGVLVERVPDAMPSSILQYVRYRNFSTYIFPVESTERGALEEQIVSLYNEIPAIHEKWRSQLGYD